MQLATAFWISRALYVATRLGVADLLADGPKSPGALAAQAGADAAALQRVLRALASLGVFVEDAKGRFRNTDTSGLLRTRTPVSLRAFVLMLGEAESWRAWGEMLYSVRTGRSAFEHVFRAPVFQYMAEHPEAGQLFDEAMTSRSADEDDAILSAYEFAPISAIIDIGGGRGALLSAILGKYPRIEGTLFDLPHVIARAREAAARYRLLAGDFFTDSIPSGSDAYILKKVVHDWDDDRAGAILRNCSRAMRDNPGSRLLLIEPVIPTGNERSFAKLLDLFMLVWPGGRERTAKEHQALLASAGLRVSRIVPTRSPLTIIEAVSRDAAAGRRRGAPVTRRASPYGAGSTGRAAARPGRRRRRRAETRSAFAPRRGTPRRWRLRGGWSCSPPPT
jgi:hypothetical protein